MNIEILSKAQAKKLIKKEMEILMIQINKELDKQRSRIIKLSEEIKILGLK